MGRIPVLVVAEQLESDKPPTDNNYKLSTKGEKDLKALGATKSRKKLEENGLLKKDNHSRQDSPLNGSLLEGLYSTQCRVDRKQAKSSVLLTSEAENRRGDCQSS